MITSIKSATDEEWQYYADSVPSAVYFQTREWFDIWADYAGFESDTKIISFDDGKQVLLPLARIKLLQGLLSAYFLSPKGMGGFLTNDELAVAQCTEVFSYLKKFKMLYCAVNPYDMMSNRFTGFNASDVTQVLDLTQGFESIVKTWSKGHYSAIKKGIREGIRVEAAATEEDWRAYYQHYVDNLSRWGNDTTNRYSWRLFELLYRKASRQRILWVARYEGKPIAGALCFYHNRHVAYWHSATSQQFFRKLSASHVLQYHIIKDACDRGFGLYDFMPSSGIQGVVKFKRGFSPQEKEVQIYMSPFMQLSRVVKGRLRNSAIYRMATKNTAF